MTLPRAPALLAAIVLLAAGARSARPDDAAGSNAAAAPAAPIPERNGCPGPSSPVAVGTAQWNGWGRDAENSRYQPEPALRATDVPKLGLKWAYGYRGAGVGGQPAVVDGRLFASGGAGRVYALDARSGCTYWTFDAAAPIQTALAVGELTPPKRPHMPKQPKRSRRNRHQHIDAHVDVDKPPAAVFFGDESGAVYAVNAQRGTLLWKVQAATDPNARIAGTPLFYHEHLYVSLTAGEPGGGGFRGSLVALAIGSGEQSWKFDGAAGAAPTVDAEHGLLYVATHDGIVALDLDGGHVRWQKRLPGGNDFHSAPILRHLPHGGRIIVAAETGGVVYGLDPDRAGELLWQVELAADHGRTRIDGGPCADHRRVYVATAAPTASLTALDIATGKIRWSTPAPAPDCSWGEKQCSHSQAQAVTVMPGVILSGSLDGHLRAYSTIDGQIVWDYDTAKEYRTVNEVRASGGSLNPGGATVVGGMVYVNSGYGGDVGQPGNVLLAFSVDGK